MKIILILVCFSFLLAGCTSARFKNQKPIWQVINDYRSIKKGMTEEEVMARLGVPDKTDKTGSLHWRAEWGGGDDTTYAELIVSVDGDERVLAAKVLQGTDHYPPVSDLPPPPPLRSLESYTPYLP